MRTDVKLGVVVAMVVVLVAGGYYMYRDREQQPIPMGDKVVSGSQTAPAASSPAKPDKQSAARSPQRPAKTTQGETRQAQRNQPHRNRAQPNQARKNQNSGRTASGAPATTPRNQRNGSQNGATKRGSEKTARPQNEKLARGPAKAAQERRRAAQNRATRSAGQPKAARPGADGNSAKRVATGERSASGSPRNRPTGSEKQPDVKLPPVNIADARTPANQPGTRAVPLTATTSAAAAVEKHRVQPGDTLSGLSIKYYGSERHTQYLIDANKHLANPNRLKIGDMVNIPAEPTSDRRSVGRQAPASSQGVTSPARAQRLYTVRPGDSFYSIALDQLGDSSRWKELLALNRALVGGEPTALQVGQVVQLPR